MDWIPKHGNKSMMSNMFADFKNDIMQSVTETGMKRTTTVLIIPQTWMRLCKPSSFHTKVKQVLLKLLQLSHNQQRFETLLSELNSEKASSLGVLINSLLIVLTSVGDEERVSEAWELPDVGDPKVNTMLWGHLKQDQENLVKGI